MDLFPVRVIFLGLIVVSYFSSRCVSDSIPSFDINPFQVIPLLVAPLQEQTALLDTVTVVNDGNGVTVTVDKFDNRSYVQGGMLGNYLHIKYQIRYNYNASIFGTAGITFNGFGTPLVVDAFVFNTKYGSVLEAAFYPDGIVIIRDSIKIGAPNFFFPPFEAVLNQIQKPGSYYKSNLATCASFVYPFALRTYYYSYKSPYTITVDQYILETGTATIMVTPLPYSRSISLNQFNAFQRLLVRGQSSLTTNSQLFKQHKSPVNLVGGIFSVFLVP